MGVEAAESMSMNLVSGSGPLYAGLSDQSPCSRSYTPIRENEFHLLKRMRSPACPFVSITSNPARPVSWPTSGTSTITLPIPAMRARCSAGAKRTAATTASAAAVSTTPGAPSALSSGISIRQPIAAPVRSAPYTALIRDEKREIAMVITSPPEKNGSAARM